VLASCCYTMISSVSALSMHTSAAILLDLARLFLDLMVTVQVSGNVAVSVLLPIVELLEFGTCSHLVSLLLNVVLDDLENVSPIVDGKLGRGSLPCLGGLHDLVLLGRLHVHVVLSNVGPRGLCVNLGNFVLDSSFTFFASITLQSA
jgi:hypothetical protein